MSRNLINNEPGRFVRPAGYFNDELELENQSISDSDEQPDAESTRAPDQPRDPTAVAPRFAMTQIENPAVKANIAALNLITELRAKDWKEARMKWPNWKRLLINLLEMNHGLTQQQKYSILLAKGGWMIQKIAFDRPPLPDETSATLETAEPSFDNLIQRFEHHLDRHANFVIDIETFQKATQEEEENMADFVTRLQDLGKLCRFPDAEMMIKAQILKGARQKNELVKQCLVNENITVEKLEAFGSRLELYTKEFDIKSEHDTYNVKPEVVGALKVGDTGTRQETTARANSEWRDRGYATFKQHDNTRGRTFTPQNVPSPYNRQVSYNSRYRDSGSERSDEVCTKCGLNCLMRGCPARGADCKKCGKLNHFARCCKSDRRNDRIGHVAMERNIEVKPNDDYD